MSKRLVSIPGAAVWVTAALLPCFLAAESPAGTITASLKADPSTINEGGWTTLTLSVHDRPNTGGISYFDNGYYTSNYWWTGNGSLDSVGASIFSGDGQAKTITNGSITGTDYKGSVAMQYLKPGDYMASVSGAAYSRDRETGYWGHYYWVWQGSWWGGYWQRYWTQDGSGSWDVGSYSNISASTQIHVNNVAPTITEIDWTPIVQTGEGFDFTVTATDPGLAGGERLTYAFDFSGSGLYNDLVLTGGASASGSYQFDTEGEYTVGIKVSDDNGGVTYGSFKVSAVPEPASVLSLGLGVATLLGFTWRRRKQAVPAAS